MKDLYELIQMIVVTSTALKAVLCLFVIRLIVDILHYLRNK